MGRQMEEDRITLEDAMAMLQVSRSTLEDWMTKAKLRKQLDKQRYPDDMRQRFLTRAQLEQLAVAHRRQLPNMNKKTLQAQVDELTAEVYEIKARVKALEDARSPADDDLPI